MNFFHIVKGEQRFFIGSHIRHAAYISLREVTHMGYRVEYDRGRQKRRQGRGRLLVLTAAVFLGFLLLVNGLWPRGRETLQAIVFPGDRAVTAAAWEEMTAKLQAGEPVGSAFEAFCREIIDHAGLSSP